MGSDGRLVEGNGGVDVGTMSTPPPPRTTELRRRLLALSARIHWHPFWATPAGRTPAARAELRQRTAADRTQVAA
ncbi:hypothetical protein [Streptomyces microflavus]|uniref:Uncharacterized protein n=1 Tax=Streptomyces microflavus TaxID=1919 RepID=A0ABV1QBP2_STRMI